MDGLTVSAGPGVCYTKDGRRLINSTLLTYTIPAPVLGFVSAYAVPAPTGRMAALQVVSGDPAAAYLGTARHMPGNESSRYLGSGMIVNVNGQLRLRPGRHLQVLPQGSMVMLDMASSTGGIPFNLLSGLTASTVQTLDLSGIVPITSRCARIQVMNGSNRAIYIGLASRGTVSKTNHLFEVLPGASPLLDVPLDPNRTCTLVQTTDSLLGLLGAILSGSSRVNCAGYYYDR